MTLKQSLRYQKNKELLEELAKAIEANPEQRFGQILRNYGFVKENRALAADKAALYGIDWKNEFYEESEKILERVKSLNEK